IIGLLVASQARRQSREIGLLMALGTRPMTVMLMFVARAGLVGGLGAVAGYLLGHPLTNWFAGRFLEMSVPVQPGLLAPLVGIGIAVSLAASAIPAFRAARLDPSVVLREV
ncbi:MAG: FtsX-like permease family protein, partial [Deltaproteobacteria bacterium]|nr:FtsX-like permease family protein [Deltaproteobacteria bacterium]